MPEINVKINSMYPPSAQGSIRAYATVDFDKCFAVRGVKVVQGSETGLFVSMPSRKTLEGYKEICYPVTAEFREQLHNAVLDAYQQALMMAQTEQTAPEQTAPEQAAPEQEAPGPQMTGM
nr:SpoVG family protein [uncultured Eisenbergiella sp.]